jgi:hypothetical protein
MPPLAGLAARIVAPMVANIAGGLIQNVAGQALRNLPAHRGFTFRRSPVELGRSSAAAPAASASWVNSWHPGGCSRPYPCRDFRAFREDGPSIRTFSSAADGPTS